MAVEDVTLAYRADIQDVTQKVKIIQRVNKIAAKELGTEFSKNINLVSSQLRKLQFDKKFQIRADDGQLKKVTGTVSQFDRVLQTADGRLFKFSESLGTANGKTVPLTSSISAANQKANQLIGTSSKLATNFNNLSSVNQSFSKQLRGFGTVSRKVGTSLNQITDSGAKTSKIFETTNGKFVQLTQTVKRLPNGIQQVDRSVKEMSKSQADSARILEKNNKTTRGFADNLKTLAKRAALTIPVWFALRQGVGSFLRAIREGVGDIVEFDRALQKLRRNISATSADVEGDFQRTRKEIEDFSLRTGKSVEEVTRAVQRFATVGFDIETSLVGGLKSTQLAVTLFGEAEETANAFARSLRVLTEGIDDPAQQQREIANALALTDQLWQTNAFEVDEFSNNLEKFAGVANIANLSIQDTIALLATLSTGGLGERGGRLLRTTVLRSLSDIEGISRKLDLDFDPQSGTSLEFILSMIDALKELGVTGERVPEGLVGKITEIFNVRSAEPIAALVSLEKTLKENLALEPDLNKFDQTLEHILGTTGSLAEQFSNANREIGKAFVSGIVGAEKFEESLEKILKTQLKVLNIAESSGAVFRNSLALLGLSGAAVFLRAFGTGIIKGFSGIMLKTLPGIAAVGAGIIVNQVNNEIPKAINAGAKAFEEEGENIGRRILKGLNKELNLSEITDLISDIEVFGPDLLGLDPVKTEKALDRLKEFRQELQKIADERKTQDESQLISDTNLENIKEAILKRELDILKTRGASNSQLIQAEQIGRKRLDIEKEILGRVTDQLNKEKEINAERRLGADVASDDLKLFRIAQTEGTLVASQIGDVLAGNVDFSNFVRRGGKALEVFKDQFSDIFEAQQARAFFAGNTVPGSPGLTGGRLIDTEQDFSERTDSASLTANLLTAQSKAVSLFERLTREQTKSDDSTDNLTKELQNTQRSLGELTTAFNSTQIRGTDSAGNRFELGQPLTGQDARDFLFANQLGELSRSTVSPQRQVIDLNLNIGDREINLTGTPENVQRLADQAGSEVGRAVQQLINNIANKPESPEAQAVRKRIVEE